MTFCVCGCRQHCGQIPPEFNLQVAGVRRAIRSSAAVVDGRSPGWGEDDLVDQAAKSLGGLDPRVGFLQRLNEAVDFLPVELSHAGMQEWWRLGRGANLAFSSSRLAAFPVISSRTSDAGTPCMTISINFWRRTSMRSISRSAAVKLARYSIRRRSSPG